MIFPRIFLIFGLSIILVGCPSAPMYVKVISSTAKDVSIEMFKRDGWSGRKYPQKISSIYFSKSLRESQVKMPVWSINCNDERYCGIMHVKYGELPIGFVAVEPIQPIHAGDTLWVSVWGEGHLGTTEITIH
jgi:hypothetical protein